jgi:2,3-bisphosphoglycerate-independent phosphoglycerate mutase
MRTPFTLEGIGRAHNGVTHDTVRKYLADLRDIGVRSYTTHVSDGHSEYFDARGASLSSEPVHEPYAVADAADRDAVRQAIEAHSRGETNYFAFSKQLAAAGASTWVMDPIAMTCTFYSKAGELLLADDV